MNGFDYVAVFVSLVLAIGLTHLLGGAIRIFHNREQITAYWVYFAGLANLFIMIVNFWWVVRTWSAFTEWTFFHYLFVATGPVLVYLLIGVYVPENYTGRNQELRSYYYRIKRPFFSLYIASFLYDFADTALKGFDRLTSLGWGYLLANGGTILLFAVAMLTRKHWYHATIQIYLFVAFIGLRMVWLTRFMQ